MVWEILNMHLQMVFYLTLVVNVCIQSSTSYEQSFMNSKETFTTINASTTDSIRNFRAKNFKRKTQVVTASLGWTSFAGCSIRNESDTLQTATNSKVRQIFTDIFSDSIYAFKEEGSIFSCSKHCEMDTNSTHFTFYKDLCQCISNVSMYQNSQRKTCIDTSSCIDFQDGFCANGFGLPFYHLRQNMNHEVDGSFNITSHRLYASRCVIQTNGSNERVMDDNTCKRHMRSTSCSFQRIIYQLKTSWFVEWICLPNNGQAKRYFRISKLYKKDINQTEGKTDTNQTNGGIEKDYDNTTTIFNTAGSFSREYFQVVAIGGGVLIILSLSVCNIISLQKKWTSEMIKIQGHDANYVNDIVQEDAVHGNEIVMYNVSNRYESIDQNQMDYYDYADDSDIEFIRERSVNVHATSQAQLQLPSTSNQVRLTSCNPQNTSTRNKHTRLKQSKVSRFKARCPFNQLYLIDENETQLDHEKTTAKTSKLTNNFPCGECNVHEQPQAQLQPDSDCYMIPQRQSDVRITNRPSLSNQMYLTVVQDFQCEQDITSNRFRVNANSEDDTFNSTTGDVYNNEQ